MRPPSLLVPRIARLPEAAGVPRGECIGKLYEDFTTYALAPKTAATRANHKVTQRYALSLPPHPGPGDISVWFASLRALGMAETSVGAHRWNLLAVYNYGNAAGWVIGNPVKLCPYTTVRSEPRGIPDLKGIWPELLATAPEADTRLRAFLGVMRFLAPRIGEALALRASDVLCVRGASLSVSLTRQRPTPNKLDHFAAPKFGSARTLPARPGLVELLAPLLALPAAEVWTGRGGQLRVKSPLLFPYRVNDLQRIRKALALVCPEGFGLGDAFHTFRHGLALEFVHARKSVEDVSRWLGHASVGTTMTYLAKLQGKTVPEEVISGLD